jgi:subtilase family serine protease
VAFVVTALSVAPAAAQSVPGPQVGASYSSGLYAPSSARVPFTGSFRAVCGKPGEGVAQCLTDVLQPSGANPEYTDPTGLSPATIEDVYGFTSSSTAGLGQTIALVDAYNDPDAAGDLNEFSEQYGLPPECNGYSSPCFNFTQVNQAGGSGLPTDSNSDWDLEISLDIEWAHALAPAANILLVEANDSDTSDLLAAEQYAAANAKYVSNSWGTTESPGENLDDSSFTDPGVSYFAAAGDTGGEVTWPSASPDVISVGGTSLTFSSGGTLAQESAWSDGGGGCSVYEPASVYQTTGSVNCNGMRATPDISLDADPNSGVSVYDSVPYSGQTGWWTVGGTSASTPMVAAEAAVTGADVDAAYLYANPANIPFRAITSGSNGYPALPGYNLATGLGAWSYTPGAPTGLSASGSGGGVTLDWTAPSGAAPSQYTIWRGTATGDETTDLVTVAAPTTTYTDNSATGSSTYFYEVQALDSSGVGPFSNEASAKSSGTSYTVTFNANGGTGTMAPETEGAATALAANAFTRSGYAFLDWNTAANGSGTAYTNGEVYPFTASVTLYAQWTPNPSYTVTFNANGGTGTMAPETDNVATALTGNTFTRSGYAFSAWNTAANGSGTAYTNGETYPFTASVTLYAQWTPNPSYTVTFNANGGAGTMSPETDSVATALTMNAFALTGYSFSNWNTVANGSGTAYTNGEVYPFTASATLYAQWTPNPSYTVTFNANGGTGTMAPETDNVATALTANAFALTGYSFSGWNTAANGSGTAYTNGETYPFTGSATLYAQWTPNPSYTVTFNANGGAGTMSPETDSVATALTPNAFTQTGYSFSDWNTAANGSGIAYANEASYPFTASVTLYAQWTSNPSYTVTFNANGGTGTMAPETDSVATALTPNAFTQTGYSFSDWNTAANGSGIAYGDGASYPFTASVTLYAQWTADASSPPPPSPSPPPAGPPPAAPSPPTVTGISPTSGPVAGGMFVTITGTGFSTTGSTTVDFGTTAALAVSCSSTTSCTAISPSEPAGTVNVTVNIGTGTSTTAAADQFSYVAAPTITKMTPTSGPAKGGTKVTIRGSNFLGSVSVQFGGRTATGIRVLSSSEITVTAPSGLGTVYVTVSALGGTSKPTAASKYDFVPAPTITKVTSVGTTKLIIEGSNFVGTVSVRFGGKAARGVHVLSSSEITVIAPSASGTIYVTVSALGGSSKKTVELRY